MPGLFLCFCDASGPKMQRDVILTRSLIITQYELVIASANRKLGAGRMNPVYEVQTRDLLLLIPSISVYEATEAINGTISA